MLIVQTQAARWKAADPEQLTGAHLYLDIVKSGDLFHSYSGGMIDTLSIPCPLRWMSQELLDDKSNIGSGNSLVPSGTKPLPEPMLTQIYVIWRH